MIRKLAWGVAGLIVLVIGVGLFKTFRVPDDLWVATRQFAPCPSRPSCVSSTAKDEVHRIEPLRYAGDPAPARQKLEQLIRGMPLATIESATPEYLHAVFRTPTMRFHDDVELLVQAGGVIQVRSISRFGYGDHGVNRARVEGIREAFGKQ